MFEPRSFLNVYTTKMRDIVYRQYLAQYLEEDKN